MIYLTIWMLSRVRITVTFNFYRVRFYDVYRTLCFCIAYFLLEAYSRISCTTAEPHREQYSMNT